MRQAPSQKKERVRLSYFAIATRILDSRDALPIFRRDHGCAEVGQRPGGTDELEDVLATGLGSTVMTTPGLLGEFVVGGWLDRRTGNIMEASTTLYGRAHSVLWILCATFQPDSSTDSRNTYILNLFYT